MGVCAACGAENAESAKFCSECGAALSTVPATRREERKVVTVVFADMVGSTERAEALDPEDVRAVLAPFHTRLRQELERHGGRVEKFIGDAVVAVFGAPVAHEDDAERAVRAALAIQEAIAEMNEADPTLALEVRIGVNTGEALVALDARPELGEGVVSGDVVNTGARLQSAAPPGGILVGEYTYRATERAIEYEAYEPVSAKGKSAPLQVWRALERRARYGIDLLDVRSPLVGRDEERDVLIGALARARTRLEPQFVTVVGVPGIGKSRLVRELFRVVDDDPELIVWRQGRSLPYGETSALWALAEIVKAQAGILESDSVGQATGKVEASVHDLVPDDGEAAWIVRHVLTLVGIRSEADVREASLEEAFAAWRRFLEALAEKGPVVLVFEDLHWADDALLDFVDALADRVAGVPLLVVCSARPELLERRPGWGGGKRNAATVSLAPLTDEDTARLLAGLLERPVLPADEQRALLQRAGGNPLFAEEYARLLAAGASPDAEAPETVQGMVAARIDALPAEEKELLQLASALGKVFWTDGLASLSGADPWRLDEPLHALERKEFVRREHRSAVAGSRQYAFVHALVRDGAYGQMSRAVRADVHRRIADWIAALPEDRADDRADMQAHHLLEAIAYGRAAGLDVSDLVPRASAALREAGEREWRLGTSGSAIAFLERARGVEPVLDADPYFLFRLGRMLLTARGQGAPELDRAIELLGDSDPATTAMAEVLRGEVVWQRGDQEGAFPYFDRAAGRVRDLPISQEKAFVVAQTARFMVLAGRSAESLEPLDEAISMAETLGDRELLGDTLNTRGIVRLEIRDPDWQEDFERCLEILLDIRSRFVLRAYLNFGSSLFDVGEDVLRAERVTREGLPLAEQIDARVTQRWIRSNLAEFAYCSGRWGEALGLVEKMIADEPHYVQGAAFGVRALIRLARGDIEGAVEDAEVTVREGRAIRDPQALVPALVRQALVLVRAGDAKSAAALLDETIAAVDASRHYRGDWVVAFALASRDLGRELPPEVVSEESRDMWVWGRAAAAIASGEAARAADILEDAGAKALEAEVRLLAARDLTAHGRRAEAAVQLAAALAFYREVGATAYVRAAEALLAEAS